MPKSILSILTLAASRGTDLKIVASGDDEQEALDAVVGLFSRDFDETEKDDGKQISRATNELRCKGLGVSDGVVIGRVLRLQEGTREVYRAEIAEADLERERRRFRAAVRLSRRQLEAIKDRAEKRARPRSRVHSSTHTCCFFRTQNSRATSKTTSSRNARMPNGRRKLLAIGCSRSTRRSTTSTCASVAPISKT